MIISWSGYVKRIILDISPPRPGLNVLAPPGGGASPPDGGEGFPDRGGYFGGHQK